MTFLNPLGLLGLLGLPVIVFFHLRRERARQMLVSSLDLWSFLDTKHTGTRARYLPLTWLLLVHLLIAALLSLAFSQPRLDLPFFPGTERHLIVLLDTSSSMLATDARPTRFDAARSDLLALLAGNNSADLVTIITFGARAELLGDSRQMELSSIQDVLASLQAGAVGDHLSEALALASAHASPDLPIDLRIYTDGAFPAPQIESYPYIPRWERYGSDASNQAILDMAVEVIGENRLQVFVSLANFGGQAVQGDLILLADGEEINTASLQLPPSSTAGHIWDLTGQPTFLEVRLSGTDILQPDDAAFFGMPRNTSVTAALITDTPEPLARAVEAVGNVNVLRTAPANYAPSLDVDIYVFRAWLPEKLPAGFVLVFDPPLDSPLLSVGSTQEITALPVKQPDSLLDGLDFAGVRWGRTAFFPELAIAFEPLLIAGDIALLQRAQPDDTDLLVFTPMLVDGNFTRHPAFPVLVSNAVNSVRDNSLPSNLMTGQSFELPPDVDFPLVRVLTPGGETQQLFSPRNSALYTDTERSGFYRIENVAQSGEITVDWLGINAGERSESDLTQGDWLAGFESAEITSAPTAPGLDLTPWLLLVAFAFLAFEGWLAWR